MVEIAKFIGLHVSKLLNEKPFEDWPQERETIDDLEEQGSSYTFHHHGLVVKCDSKDEISTIFIMAKRIKKIDPNLFGIPFSWTRVDVLNSFGEPTKSGEPKVIPELGEYGGYDRFDYETGIVHFEYAINSASIRMVTLMRPDVAP